MIVTGPARSGTTILFELLGARSGAARAARLRGDCIRCRAAPPGDRGERLAWSECEQELWADVQPEFAAIHELRSDLPVECVTLTIPSFCGTHWMMVAQLGGWAPDIERMYDFHRRLLQVMQHGAPRATWLLKTPGHLMTLESLFATYPDAWIVQTHRDPAKTMPSTVSTTAMVQWMRTDHVDVAPLARAIEMAFVVRAEPQRRAAHERTVHRIASSTCTSSGCMRDPVQTLARRRTRRWAASSGPSTPSASARTCATSRRASSATHRYAPEDWGFTAAVAACEPRAVRRALRRRARGRVAMSARRPTDVGRSLTVAVETRRRFRGDPPPRSPGARQGTVGFAMNLPSEFFAMN